jgi:hypothetical protein
VSDDVCDDVSVSQIDVFHDLARQYIAGELDGAGFSRLLMERLGYDAWEARSIARRLRDKRDTSSFRSPDAEMVRSRMARHSPVRWWRE